MAVCSQGSCGLVIMYMHVDPLDWTGEPVILVGKTRILSTASNLHTSMVLPTTVIIIEDCSIKFCWCNMCIQLQTSAKI